MQIKVKCTGYKQPEKFFTIGKVYTWENNKLTNDRGFTYGNMVEGPDPEKWSLSKYYHFEVVDTQKIVITTDGKETLARLYDGDKVIKSATAKCNPGDTFDFATGAKLAFKRLTGEEKKEFVPHIKMATGERVGNIGEPTNYKDAIGRPLRIGDTVEHFNDGCESYGETIIAKDKDMVFVMGIKAACNDKTGSTGSWKIIKKRSHEDVADGETVFRCTYVKSEK